MKKDKNNRYNDWEKKFVQEVKIETSKELSYEPEEGIRINQLSTSEDLLNADYNDVHSFS